MSYKSIKRLIDIVLACLAVIILLPAFIAVAIAVRIKLGEGVFFTQERPGLFMRPFKMLKFRTMTNAVDSNSNALPDTMRISPLGQWLRASSLDELPGLFNVIRGEMSLIGPRPLLMQYVPLYTKRQAGRHDVRPGITGLAQVNGRNAISWEKKFEFDLHYVNNFSLAMDIHIALKTVIKVFRRENITNDNPNDVGMEYFTGTPDKPDSKLD